MKAVSVTQINDNVTSLKISNPQNSCLIIFSSDGWSLKEQGWHIENYLLALRNIDMTLNCMEVAMGFALCTKGYSKR